nr:hypothetical protein [Tanacetum cinerariifolium]
MENEHELSYETLTRVYLGSYEHYKSVGAGVEPLELGFELDDQEWVESGTFSFELIEQRFASIMGYIKKKWGISKNERCSLLFRVVWDLGGQADLVAKLRTCGGVYKRSRERCGHFKDQKMDCGACKQLVGEGGGNNSSGTKKCRGSNSGDGGNTRDGVKIVGGAIRSCGGIGGLLAALYACTRRYYAPGYSMTGGTRMGVAAVFERGDSCDDLCYLKLKFNCVDIPHLALKESSKKKCYYKYVGKGTRMGVAAVFERGDSCDDLCYLKLKFNCVDIPHLALKESSKKN